MIRWLTAALAALLLATQPVTAQNVQQSGTFSPGHLTSIVTSGLIKDAGSPSNFQTNALGLYNGANNPFAISSQTASGALPATFCTLSLGATTANSVLTAQNQAGSGCPLNLNIGGVTYTIGGLNWLSTIFDNQFCSTIGAVLYRNTAGAWQCLGPGNSGQVLQTQGVGQNPQWAGSGGIGTVTSITAGTGLTGGTITTSGTIGLSSPVSVANGGTASTALTAHSVVLGEGTSAVAFAAPGVAGTCLQSNGTTSDPTFQSCPGTGTVTSISSGTGITVSPSPITSSGTVSLASAPNAQLGAVQAPGGRLTLQTGVPVQTADQTAVATVYYDTYVTNQVPIYSGTAWAYFTVTADEISLALDSNSGHTGYQASGSLFDLFIGNNSGITLCTGPAWSTTTSRGTGAGTTQISRLNGIWTNTVSMTCRFGAVSGNTFTCGVNQCTYVGTMYATANGQTTMQVRPAGAGGGNLTILGLYNGYNREPFTARAVDSNASWPYAVATWRAADGSNNNRINFIDGLQQSPLYTSYTTLAQSSAVTGAVGVALDWTANAPTGQVGLVTANIQSTVQAQDNLYPQLGLHYVQAIEWASGATMTFYGSGVTPGGGGGITLLKMKM